jgi:hypothetical protein
VVYLVLALNEINSTALGLTPISFYFLWYSVSAGIAAVYISTELWSSDSVLFLGTRVASEDVADGYIIFLVGALALHAGLQRFRPEDQSKEAPSERDLPAGAVGLTLLYVAGFVAGAIPSLLKPLGYIGGVVTNWTAIAALCCFALTPPSEIGLSQRSFRVMLLIGTIALFVENLFLANSKAATMFSLLPGYWCFWVRPSVRRWLPLLALCGIGIYSGVYQVITTGRRNFSGYTATGYSKAGPQLPEILASIVTLHEGASPSFSLSDQLDDFFHRQFEPLPVGFIVHEVRESGLMMGETMRYVSYMFIPRLFWADKPEVTRGSWFSYYLGFADSPDWATTSTGESAQGELYWNFGLPGVIIGMFIIGALLGSLWQLSGAHPHRQPLRMMLYVSTMIQMQQLVEAGTIIDGTIASVIVFGGVFYLAQLFDPT